MYAIYDMKNKEVCVGVFKNRKEVAHFFNTTSNSIGSSICRREKREHRYLIERIDVEDDNDDE